MSDASTTRARYIMIGGFLGAGKTTSVGRLAQWLTDKGHKVGLITNDQGDQLVDTAYLRSKGFSTEEISGGCFCCRFNSLTDAADKLTKESKPGIFIAEPVGSCTDLVATVSYPLRRIYGSQYTVAPLSVLVDPRRAMQVLGLTEGRTFSSKVLYIYKKQLEEADIIVINKSDLLSEDQLARLRETLQSEFPNAQCVNVSARTGDGLEAWFSEICAKEQVARDIMTVDYDVYAEGEALLGWLNATVNLKASDPVDPDQYLRSLAQEISIKLDQQSIETAHLKMTLSPDAGLGGVAVINLVGGDFVPELSQTLDDSLEAGQVIVNLRAEGDPSLLEQTLRSSIEALSGSMPGLEANVDHLEFFRPGKPEPTHRISLV